MKFSLKMIFAATFLCAALIWLVGIRTKERQRELSLERNSYTATFDGGEARRKQIGRVINELGHYDSVKIGNCSIHFHADNSCQIALHCVGWHHGNVSRAELSNGDSVTEIELTPLGHYRDGMLRTFSGNLDVDWAKRETSNFEDFRVRLIDSENQALTDSFPVWVWGTSDDHQVLIHQPLEWKGDGK